MADGIHGSQWSHVYDEQVDADLAIEGDDYNVRFKSSSRCVSGCHPTFLKWDSGSLTEPTNQDQVRKLQKDCTCVGYNPAGLECKAGGYCMVYGTHDDPEDDGTGDHWSLASFCVDQSNLRVDGKACGGGSGTCTELSEDNLQTLI